MPDPASASTDRVAARRRAVALARHYRDNERPLDTPDLPAPRPLTSTVKAYFYDPTREKARAVKARYVGVCRGCGAYAQPRKGARSRLHCFPPCGIQQTSAHELLMSRILFHPPRAALRRQRSRAPEFRASGQRGAARWRLSVSSRRFVPSAQCAVAGGHDHRVDAAIAVVAKGSWRQRVSADRSDRPLARCFRGTASPMNRTERRRSATRLGGARAAKAIVSELRGFRAKEGSHVDRG
jgi:hypothetical protein